MLILSKLAIPWLKPNHGIRVIENKYQVMFSSIKENQGNLQNVYEYNFTDIILS